MPRNLSNDSNDNSNSSNSGGAASEDPTFNSVQTNTLVAPTCKTSSIQTLDGEGETLQIRCNFITAPEGSTLQLAPNQLNAISTVSSQSNMSAGTDISAVGNIVSATGRVEATEGALIGNSAAVSTVVTCQSVDCSNGSYDDQEVRCGRINLSSGAHDGWSILQGSNGSDLQDTLGIASPNANGVFTVFDENFSPLLIQSKNGLICQTQMNQNGNLTLSAASNLSIAGYNVTPQQYYMNIASFTIKASIESSTRLFNTRTQVWIRRSDAGTRTLYDAAFEGYWKISITQTGASSSNNWSGYRILADFVLVFPNVANPDIVAGDIALNYGFKKAPSNALSPSLHIDQQNAPSPNDQEVYLTFPNQTGVETMPIEVRLTKLPY